MARRIRPGLWLGIALLGLIGGGSSAADEIAAVAGDPVRPSGNSLMPYTPTVVQLDGMLRVEREYGPPGFGETPKVDMKLEIPMLLLAAPIGVLGNPEDELNSETITGIRKLQLSILASSETDGHIGLVGKRVVVTGTLAAASVGTHFTPVVFEATAIRAYE